MKKIIGKALASTALAWATATSAGPITDTVIVDNREWAQVDLFLGLTWDDINSACPAGACGTGILNGYDMSGWTWASVADTNALFNSYLIQRGVPGGDLLDPAKPDKYAGTFFTLPFSLFFQDGWRRTFATFTPGGAPYSLIDGWSSDAAAGPPGSAYHAYYSWVGVSIAHTVTVDTSTVNAANDAYLFFEPGLEPIPNNPGGWFYRDASEVSIPSTLWLFGCTLLGLGAVNRKHANAQA